MQRMGRTETQWCWDKSTSTFVAGRKTCRQAKRPWRAGWRFVHTVKIYPAAEMDEPGSRAPTGMNGPASDKKPIERHWLHCDTVCHQLRAHKGHPLLYTGLTQAVSR